MRVVVVSGLSGAGKSVALKQYEDLGYYCIDNLPLALIPPLIRRLRAPERGGMHRLALGIDARERGSDIRRFPGHLAKLRQQGIEVSVLFLTATDEVLLRRYSETRRRHPLSSPTRSLPEAIAYERELLAPIADSAEDAIDTSHMNLHELREALHARLPEAGAGRLSVLFLSFGFKHGVPDGIDYLFDVRCLPNPHWVPPLRAQTGRDPAVAAWLTRHPEVTAMRDDIHAFLARWLPAFRAQDRAYVTVAIGCTGGQHRSVLLVEQLAERFRGHFDEVSIRHRELG